VKKTLNIQNQSEIIINKTPSAYKAINSEIFYISHSNVDYKLILEILNKFGPITIKSLKEKLKELTNGKNEIKSDTTYYRYLRNLEDAGLVIEAGRKIHPKKTSAKILYNCTSDLFISTGFGKEIWSTKLGKQVARSIISVIDPDNINNELSIQNLEKNLSKIEDEEILNLNSALDLIIPKKQTIKSEFDGFNILSSLKAKDSIQFWNLLRFLNWFLKSPNINLLKKAQSFLAKTEKKVKTNNKPRSISQFKTDYRDLTHYQILPVLSTSDEVHRKYFANRNYKAILQLLYREAPKTLKEIAKLHHQTVLKLIEKQKKWFISKGLKINIKEPKPKKIDTIYRYLNDLQEGGLIIEAGRRITPRKSYTEILYSRTAELYYYWGNELEYYNTKSWEKVTSILINSLEIFLNRKVVNTDKFRSIISDIEIERSKSLHDSLESNISNEILLESMNLFTDEQHVLFLESLSFLSWLKRIDAEKLRSDILKCFEK
jgi:Fe2+ or Zn2+ uptake regulation protein